MQQNHCENGSVNEDGSVWEKGSHTLAHTLLHGTWAPIVEVATRECCWMGPTRTGGGLSDPSQGDPSLSGCQTEGVWREGPEEGGHLVGRASPLFGTVVIMTVAGHSNSTVRVRVRRVSKKKKEKKKSLVSVVFQLSSVHSRETGR
jgi:hypothetical protein